jgi:uncharacterized protein YutE (UPF0331/DUF86 family)
MTAPWRGIERRLERLADCTAKLQVLSERPRAAFDGDSWLRDVAERNFEVAAWCVIDVSMRVGSFERARRTSDAASAIRRMGEIGVIEAQLAASLVGMAGFRNVLAHEYEDVDWDVVWSAFGRLDELRAFDQQVRAWLAGRDGGARDDGDR